MKIKLTPFRFVDQEHHAGGELYRDLRCHACWYYYTLCEKARQRAGDSISDQIILEDDAWRDKHYGQVAESVATLYGLKDPGEFLKSDFMKAVEREARRLKMPPPAYEYWHGMTPRKKIII